ncbi:hypothetical protein D3C85_1842300 [compost metagenome]
MPEIIDGEAEYRGHKEEIESKHTHACRKKRRSSSPSYRTIQDWQQIQQHHINGVEDPPAVESQYHGKQSDK